MTKGKKSTSPQGGMKSIFSQMRALGIVDLEEALLERASKDLTSEHDLDSVEIPQPDAVNSLIESILQLENAEEFWSFLGENDVSLRHVLVWIKVKILPFMFTNQKTMKK